MWESGSSNRIKQDTHLVAPARQMDLAARRSKKSQQLLARGLNRDLDPPIDKSRKAQRKDNLSPRTNKIQLEQKNMAKKIVARAFGARLLGGPAASETATQVLLGQNRLWNKLVEIERDARVAYWVPCQAATPSWPPWRACLRRWTKKH